MEESIDHPHCIKCIKWKKCTVQDVPGKSCKIINCPLDCGAVFHACKGEEHKNLCMHEKVPCINAESGCPATMLRKYRSKHLPSCPASIIYCSEEWDRWPIHFHKTSPPPISDQIDSTLKSQLDVSLAMRDQRMLRRWCYAASKGQSLSDKKFTISPSSSLWIFRKWQSSREYSFPPGLQQSVCNELCKTCKLKYSNSQRNHCSTKAYIDVSQNNEKYTSHDENSTEHVEADKENSGDSNNIQMSKDEQDTVSKENIESEILYDEETLEECSELDIKDLPHYSMDDVLQFSQLGTIVYNQNSGIRSIYVAVDPADTHHLNSCLDHKNLACQILDLKFRNPKSTPPWCLSLGLDLNLESRSQHPFSNFMYTFLCSQDFRRDQYGWHYKNVHSEIHSGLNGWLVERCPLAQYGCKFARKRFNPATTNFSIVYNENLESYGITQNDHLNDRKNLHDNGSKSCSTQVGSLNLLDLPFDVLRYIAQYLDSFSLANVSMTSTLLRDVCYTTLKDKGLVQLIWKRYKKKDGKYTWKVAEKKWFFSSHFSPIQQWSVEEKDNMCNHLKDCPYFNRVSQKKAFCYEHPKNIEQPSDKRFCDPFSETNHQDTTKL